jgi:hypothetical protein
MIVSGGCRMVNCLCLETPRHALMLVNMSTEVCSDCSASWFICRLSLGVDRGAPVEMLTAREAFRARPRRANISPTRNAIDHDLRAAGPDIRRRKTSEHKSALIAVKNTAAVKNK